MRAGWREKNANKLHCYIILTPITTQATKLVSGESWAVTVLLTIDFIPRPHLVAIISKRSDRRRHYCLCGICINGEKIVIITQKFLRFVFPVQRCAVTKASIIPSWLCWHFLTSFFIFLFCYCSQETHTESNNLLLFAILSRFKHFFKDLLLNKLPPVLESVPAGGLEAARQWRHRRLAHISGTTGGLRPGTGGLASPGITADRQAKTVGGASGVSVVIKEGM